MNTITAMNILTEKWVLESNMVVSNKIPCTLHERIDDHRWIANEVQWSNDSVYLSQSITPIIIQYIHQNFFRSFEDVIPQFTRTSYGCISNSREKSWYQFWQCIRTLRLRFIPILLWVLIIILLWFSHVFTLWVMI